jgi:hypothetical protein
MPVVRVPVTMIVEVSASSAAGAPVCAITPVADRLAKAIVAKDTIRTFFIFLPPKDQNLSGHHPLHHATS